MKCSARGQLLDRRRQMGWQCGTGQRVAYYVVRQDGYGYFEVLTGPSNPKYIQLKVRHLAGPPTGGSGCPPGWHLAGAAIGRYPNKVTSCVWSATHTMP